MASESAFVSEHYDGTYWISCFRHMAPIKELVQPLTKDQFLIAISLAATAIEQMNTSAQGIKYKELLTKEVQRLTSSFELERKEFETRISNMAQSESNTRDTLTSSFKRREQELEVEIRDLQASIQAADFANSKIREQFDQLKKTSESVMKSTLDTILKEKQQQHEAELKRLLESHKTTISTLEHQAKERVTQCDKQHKESLEQMKSMYAEQESKIRKELEKSFVSSEKGKQGEKEFEELATQYTSWPPLSNMSKTAHGTDRRCRIRNTETLFEIKNYSVDVPSREVEKFIRDMEEHQDCPLGVFISTKTNIVGKKSGTFIQTAWTPKNQLLLYINSFYSHSPQDILSFIDVCADLSWQIFKNAREDSEDPDTVLHLQGKLDQIRVFVSKELARMTELITTLSHDKKFLIESITKHHANYSYTIQQSKQALQGMMEILLGTVESTETPEAHHPEEAPKPEEHPQKKKRERAKKQNTAQPPSHKTD